MKKVFTLFLVLLASQVSFAQNGDVNNDGFVTSADVTMLYNCLLNGDTGDLVNWDQDGDGVITASDVTSVYNILLGMPTHEYVDLGLPSGTLWAATNIGANSPEDYGDYFAWGETTTKDVYNLSTYKWYDSDYNKLTKYCIDSHGFIDNKTELDPEDDAATANWGPEWRMPSKEQIKELIDNSTDVWTTRNGVRGRLVTSKINDATLFFPAAGYRWDSGYGNVGSFGSYWSRSLYENSLNAYYLIASYANNLWCTGSERSSGESVRAVRVSQK